MSSKIYAVKETHKYGAHCFKAGERVVIKEDDGTECNLLCMSLDNVYSDAQWMYENQLIDTGETL